MSIFGVFGPLELLMCLSFAVYLFCFIVVVALFIFLLKFPSIMRNLPGQIAEKLIEKLREEENRKLFERNSDPKSE